MEKAEFGDIVNCFQSNTDTYIDHVLVKNNDFRNKAQLTRQSE